MGIEAANLKQRTDSTRSIVDLPSAVVTEIDAFDAVLKCQRGVLGTLDALQDDRAGVFPPRLAYPRQIISVQCRRVVAT